MTGQFPASLPIPAEVLAIAERLEGAGFETWIVGGAVRDALLGVERAEAFDLATAATPQDVRKLFRRTIPIGIEHGTVAVLDKHDTPHEVTTFRRDVKTDGRHAVVEFGVELDEDLARRDFTINAIAYHPLRHEWRDPFGGAHDLTNKTLRAVGDPQQRFREDYLRIVRLLRFSARFGFAIDRPTWDAARASVEGLARLSAERVREEWMRGLATAREPSELARLWEEMGALEAWLPEVGRWSRGAGRGRRPFVDRFPERDPVLITAYLSADPEVTLRRLKCSNADIERGRRVAQYRGNLPDAANDVAVRRWLASVGDAADDVVAIAAAEGKGDALRAAVERARASGAPLAVGDLAVDGNDLMQHGVPKGPEVGRALRRLLDAVLADPALNERDRLLALVSPHPLSPSPETGEGGRADRAPRTAHRAPDSGPHPLSPSPETGEGGRADRADRAPLTAHRSPKRKGGRRK